MKKQEEGDEAAPEAPSGPQKQGDRRVNPDGSFIGPHGVLFVPVKLPRGRHLGIVGYPGPPPSRASEHGGNEPPDDTNT
jgi:hypothetical protein